VYLTPKRGCLKCYTKIFRLKMGNHYPRIKEEKNNFNRGMSFYEEKGLFSAFVCADGGAIFAQ
jgi:hypothetical protein